jgi:hypothetical protein
MRVLILACGWCLALAAPTQAAPLTSRTVTIELSAPPVELVAGGCGWGWHRNYWKDRWGNLRRGRCVKDWWR